MCGSWGGVCIHINVSDPSRAGVTGSCKLPDLTAGNQTQVLRKSNMCAPNYPAISAAPLFLWFCFGLCACFVPAQWEDGTDFLSLVAVLSGDYVDGIFKGVELRATTKVEEFLILFPASKQQNMTTRLTSGQSSEPTQHFRSRESDRYTGPSSVIAT